MITRHASYKEHGFDDFPTPPWATRALLKHVLLLNEKHTILEPAAGRGYMVRALRETGAKVAAFDKEKYKGARQVNFIEAKTLPMVDFVITNPPYKLAEPFFHVARAISKKGIALLVRINWLQNGGRYDRIFSQYPPTIEAQFAGRISFAKGKVIQGPAGYFQHCWLIWLWEGDQVNSGLTKKIWIPPDTQRLLEKPSDYR